MGRGVRLRFLILGCWVLALGACVSDGPEPLPPGGDCVAGSAQPLQEAEITAILGRAVAEARSLGTAATLAVVNRQGDLLAAYRMDGALEVATFDPELTAATDLRDVPLPAEFVAWSKAGTGAFLSSCGHAFSTRTASFIVQEHFPPRIEFQPGGPLFGVQFSSLPCSDVQQLPLGLSGDAGGLPLYRNGQLIGGLGVEVDGIYGLDRKPAEPDGDAALGEESIALAGVQGFEAPDEIRADRILVGGIRFPYTEAEPPPPKTPAFLQETGFFLVRNFAGNPSRLIPASIEGRPVDDPDVDEQLDCPDQIQGQSLAGYFPPVGSSQGLNEADVRTILGQAACRAVTARAAIRQPLGSAVQVNITVVDRQGRIQGLFRTNDAPIFGADVAVQKARSAAFISHPQAGNRLRAAGLARYVEAAGDESVEIDGGGSSQIRLDGQIAFSARGFGFLARPYFPDGIEATRNGPFSLPHPTQGGEWSPLNTGLQLDFAVPSLMAVLQGRAGLGEGCRNDTPGLENGFQIFAGGIPLYKNGQLVGAIGVSGDGIDQDDLVSLAGSIGFQAPEGQRSDRVLVLRPENGENELRRTRLPYVKLPRNPNLGE